jgi:hypothetical protein
MAASRFGGLVLALWLLAGCQSQDPHQSVPINQLSDCVGCHQSAYEGAAFDHASVNYDLDCAECHTETDWVPTSRPEHAQHPLLGAHSPLACAACHTAGRADPQPQQCVGCHQGVRDAAAPPHTDFADTCEVCHTDTAWKPGAFPRHDDVFPITGAHTTVACAQCHASGVYAGTPRSCAACHIEDRLNVRPDHTGWALTCEACHTDASWRPAAFPRHDSVFPLLGAHTRADCDACHADATFVDPPRVCADCHTPAPDAEPDHVGFPTACNACHTSEAWRPATFTDHDAVFPLEGEHLDVSCDRCHINQRFSGTPTTCVGCHVADRDRAPVDHQGFPPSCEACHTVAGWLPADFAGHQAVFPLVGAHVEADCDRCHINQRYTGTPTECVGCHLANRDTAAVAHEAFPNTCQTCHSQTVWRPADYQQHDAVWPIVGAHQAAECSQCHINDVFTGTPTECVGCHLANRDNAETDHSRFPNGCQTCHSQRAWQPSDYSGHEAVYPLTGAHQVADCDTCHINHVYAGTPTICVGCHLAARDATPVDHADFPDTCERCHTTAAWSPADFAGHAEVFPLEGQHAVAACDTCHINHVYRGTPSTCEGCHLAARAEAEHDHTRYPDGCAICHTAQAWRPSTYQGHDAIYPLTGAHEVADCNRCHLNDVFAGTPRDCVRCHGDARVDAQPDHDGLPDGCDTCHTTQQWRPADFAGHQQIFPLVGAHRGADCVGCHADGQYANTPRDCVGCHAAARDAAQPDHQGFPDTCDTCHGAQQWRPANYEGHDAIYPLEGAHAAAECGTCHVNGVFAGTPRDCQQCHADDRARVQEPDHGVFPEACGACHNSTAWRPADFEGHDHEAVFPLRGSHRAVECNQCHVNNVYTGTPRTCVGCHAPARDAAQPAHAGFPDDCTTCHTLVRWRPANFDGHDAVFRLEGAHTVADCGDCHINQVYAGTPRTCVGCHTTDRDRAVPPHGGFPNACDDCHGTATWRPANFNHDRFFRLEGAHVAVDCARCHINDVFDGTPTTCIGCHRDEKNRAQPNHAGFPDDCTRCHSQNRWPGAHFQHQTFRVPHEGVSRCDQCHLNQNDYAQFSCTHCHEHGRNDMNDEHRGERGYSYDNASCFRCHPQGRD